VAERFRSFSEAEIICIEQVEQAFLKALHDKDEHERLLCIGSLYLVGEILGLKGSRFRT
jgi:dihydrofolate synthase/folylpolyglutamate synthase